MNSFLLLGQSNMAGRGRFGEVEEIKSNGTMFVLRNGRWQTMSEPINIVRSVSPSCDDGLIKCGIGLSATFAECYRNTYNREIGLIPCADGGTKLDDWKVGGLLFEHAILQGKLAQRTSEISGILWHQGESDSSNVEDVQNYENKFLTIMINLLKELNIENVPIILGELGKFVEQKYPLSKQINKTLHHIAESNPKFGIASAEGLTDRGDNLHFNSVSYRILGRRYFEAYQRISKN